MNEGQKKLLIGILIAMVVIFGLSMCVKAAELPDGCNPYRKVIMSAEDEELRELEQILYLECRGEPFEGQVACCQVILNRVISDAYPDTVHDVLSQVDGGYRQFSTWKSRNKAKPGEEQSDVIEYLCDGGEWFLPYTDYLYFATRHIEGTDTIKLGKQYFSRRTTK